MKVIAIVLFIFLSIQGYTQDTIRWVKQNQLPSSLSLGQFGHFLIDSDFYVAGGWQTSVGSSPYSSQVWRYHIPTDTWFELGHLPLGAAIAASFTINGKGYILTSTDSSTSICNSKLWEYDAFSNTWTRKADFPDSPRQNSSYFVYDGKGYVGQTGICATSDAHFWQYDPIINQWLQIASLPCNLSGGSEIILSYDAKAYLFGGYDFNGSSYRDIWRYDILSNHWDSLGLMPGNPRLYIVLWGMDSVILAGGGEDDINVFNDFYIYRLSSNFWTPVVFQNFLDSALSGASFIFDKRAYYFGGTTNPNGDFFDSIGIWSADVSKYVHDTITGIREPSAKPLVSVYPNPINRSQSFFISVGQRAQVTFIDALGRVIGEQPLNSGSNRIKLTASDDIVFYRIVFDDGESATGKIVIMQ